VKKDESGISKGRLRSSYLTLIVSISLVLFLLGVLGLVIINARQLSDYLRESLSFSVMVNDDAKEPDIRMLQKDLDAKPYVKSTEYISKDEAATKLKEDLGEDFLNFLGYNPLSPTIDVFLFANYTHPDSILAIEKYILQYPVVKEVYYQESILHLIDENVNKISIFLLIISLFLLLIAFTIINNTIRLSIYSKRFIIRTMQLVGATSAFIRKPFILRSALQGLIAALVAMVLLLGLVYLIEKEFLVLVAFKSTNLLLLLGLSLIIIGILINVISTFFSVNRFLNISEDKLYYL
jgi:cell division transport system permease protein